MNYQPGPVEAMSKASVYASSGAAVLLGLTANELAAIGGLVVAFLALIINTAVNIYFKAKHLELARQRAALVATGDDDD
jgi:hypothetical protein